LSSPIEFQVPENHPETEWTVICNTAMKLCPTCLGLSTKLWLDRRMDSTQAARRSAKTTPVLCFLTKPETIGLP
jgi:hypothetical protein